MLHFLSIFHLIFQLSKSHRKKNQSEKDKNQANKKNTPLF